MIAAFDATMLILAFDPLARAPLDPATNEPVTLCQERVSHLLNTLGRTRGARIVIPTPALAEFLVRTKPETAPEYLAQLQRLRGCRIAPFAERAALEFAAMQRGLLEEVGPRRRRQEVETRAKAKFDHQIVAIARAEGADTIYSDDGGLAGFAKRFGIETLGIAKLHPSPAASQGVLSLEAPKPLPEP